MKNKWNKRLHTPSLYLCTTVTVTGMMLRGLRMFARAVCPPYVRSWFWLVTSKAQTHLIRHSNYRIYSNSSRTGIVAVVESE